MATQYFQGRPQVMILFAPVVFFYYRWDFMPLGESSNYICSLNQNMCFVQFASMQSCNLGEFSIFTYQIFAYSSFYFQHTSCPTNDREGVCRCLNALKAKMFFFTQTLRMFALGWHTNWKYESFVHNTIT